MPDRRPAPDLGTLSWPALGSTATVCAPRAQLPRAGREVARVLEAVDRLASRFRDDSELAHVNRRAGEWTAISPALAELMALALWAAEVSDGAVDPTLGGALRGLGYDRDFGRLRAVDPVHRFDWAPAIRADVRGRPWRRVRLDRDRPAIGLPADLCLDLGAVGKGYAADQAARAAHERTQAPVLVSLGGDVAVAGDPPAAGWAVAIAANHRTAPADADQAVRIQAGGLATSSLTARRWWQGNRAVHHVLHPRDGRPIDAHWVTVSATAATCAEANIATTASLVLGPAAVDWLGRHGVAGRLVSPDGASVRVGDWPA